MTREAKQFNGFELQPGMGIFAQSAGTRLGPTLMGRILPGPIRKRVGYEFFLKKPEQGSGRVWVLSKNPKPDLDITRLP